ncbi:hypothetical protein OE88DRAFT_1729365 [Heliocybe sulcata]|uniref:F-box domain-containing protein n=1 Tax=Heliocybe sulcata TaxID=5364 RepID=A0A5C3MKS5_9AGAM|nr:hypothetical protein OE88DRAFT_1729365 [Heliocybe sulcata]
MDTPGSSALTDRPHAGKSASERLPMETLSQIFISCLKSPFSTPSRAEAPLLLTEVCTCWRLCALNTTALWCSLAIVQDAYEAKKNLLHRIRVMSTWFARARERPLALSLYVWQTLDLQWQLCVPALLDILPRCRILEIGVHYTWLFPLAGETLPALEDLCASCSGCNGKIFTLEPPLQTPSLRNLNVTVRDRAECVLSSLAFPVRQLRELYWDDIQMVGPPPAHILRECDFLELLVNKSSVGYETLMANSLITMISSFHCSLTHLDISCCMEEAFVALVYEPDVDGTHDLLPRLTSMKILCQGLSSDELLRAPVHVERMRIRSRIPAGDLGVPSLRELNIEIQVERRDHYIAWLSDGLGSVRRNGGGPHEYAGRTVLNFGGSEDEP